MLDQLKQWDRELFLWLNSLGIDTYDGFWIFVTQIESWIPLFIYFGVLIFYFYRGKKGAIVLLFLLLTFFVTLAFTNLTKNYVARLRPNNTPELAELVRVLQKPTNYSFFSGHASSSFSIVTFMVMALRRFNKWIYLAYLWPLLFVLSRVYVGVHYPSDIFVGALVGALVAFGFYYICSRVLRRKATV